MPYIEGMASGARIHLVLVGSLVLAATAPTPPAPRARAATAPRPCARDTLRRLQRLRHAGRLDPAGWLRLASCYRARGTIRGRLLAQRALEDALARFPGNVDLLVALGRNYLDQDLRPDARRCFRAALARDSSRCDARAALARMAFESWRRVNAYEDDLARAESLLEAARRCAPDDSATIRRLLVAHYVLGHAGALDTLLARLERRGFDDANVLLMRATRAWERGDARTATALYLRGVDALPASERAAFALDRRSLTYAELARLDSLPAPRRDRFARAYWVRVDPDPTTSVNERWLEFAHRVHQSDVFFASPWTGRRGWWTERGEAWIRLGPPAAVQRRMTPGRVEGRGRQERWFYGSDDSVFVLTFEDTRLSGDLRIPRREETVLAWLRRTPLRARVAGDAAAIPATSDVVAFRAGTLGADVWVAMRVDADRLGRAAGRRRPRVVWRMAFFDDAWRRERVVVDTIGAIAAGRAADRAPPTLTVLERVRTSAARWPVALCIEDDRARARAVVRTRLDVSRFVDDGPVLSDLLVCAPRDTTTPAIVRGGYRLVPDVDRRIAAGEPIDLYVEVYDLGVRDGRTDYRIAWSIEPRREERGRLARWGERVVRLVTRRRVPPVVEQSFERSGTRRDVAEPIRVDVSRLPPGRWRARVRVHDRVRDARRTVTTDFEIVAGGGAP